MSAAEKLDTELEAFRAEVRDFLAKNFPPSLKDRGMMMFAEGRGSNEPDFLKWKKVMAERGWGTPSWPKQWGGGGLSKAQSRILNQEMMRVGASWSGFLSLPPGFT